MEESSDVVEVIVIPDDPPSSQDITVPSVSSTLSSCSSSSASRVTENSQSLAVHFDSRTDPTDCHLTSGVNKPPQLPMDNRRELRQQGSQLSTLLLQYSDLRMYQLFHHHEHQVL